MIEYNIICDYKINVDVCTLQVHVQPPCSVEFSSQLCRVVNLRIWLVHHVMTCSKSSFFH